MTGNTKKMLNKVTGDNELVHVQAWKKMTGEDTETKTLGTYRQATDRIAQRPVLR